MCFLNYKLRSFFPSSILSKSIENRTKRLKETIDSMEEISSKLMGLFEQVKKANAQLTRLAVQATRLKERTKLKNMYKEKEKLVSDINKAISFRVLQLFNRINSASTTIQKIIYSTDAYIFKENRRLNNFIKKIEKLENKRLARTLLNKIELVKEDLKTLAIKLYETFRIEEKGILETYSEKSQKIDIAEEVKKLDIEAAVLESSLKKLAVTNISQIYANAEKLLEDLKKIEFDTALIVPKLEELFIEIKSHVYLLEENKASLIKKRLAYSKENFDRMKKRITENAENLLKEIEIVKKIK